MRHIGNLPTADQAESFADFMLASDRRVSIDPENGEWAIWIVEEDQLEEAREELARFRSNPDDSRYRGVSSVANQKRRAEKKANEQFKKNQVNVRTRWRNSRTGLAAGPVTKLLIGASVLVALLTGLGNRENERLYWFTFYAIDLHGALPRWPGLEGILSGEIWRVFTPMFIHFDPIHILFNMMMFYSFGSQIEARSTSLKFLLLVLVLAGISNFGEYYWEIWSSINQTGLPRIGTFGGMSGVVYGLFGFIWMKALFEPQERYLLSQQQVLILLVWLVICMLGMMGNIANAAHAVGLLAGCAFGYAPTFWKNLTRG